MTSLQSVGLPRLDLFACFLQCNHTDCSQRSKWQKCSGMDLNVLMNSSQENGKNKNLGSFLRFAYIWIMLEKILTCLSKAFVGTNPLAFYSLIVWVTAGVKHIALYWHRSTRQLQCNVSQFNEALGRISFKIIGIIILRWKTLGLIPPERIYNSLLVLSSWKVNIAQIPIVIMGF